MHNTCRLLYYSIEAEATHLCNGKTGSLQIGGTAATARDSHEAIRILPPALQPPLPFQLGGGWTRVQRQAAAIQQLVGAPVTRDSKVHTSSGAIVQSTFHVVAVSTTINFKSIRKKVKLQAVTQCASREARREWAQDASRKHTTV